MIRHTLALFFRPFKRSKSSFLINVIGLSAGLTCTLLIYLWLNDEFKTDKFHLNDKRLYQVMEHVQYEQNIATNPYTSGLLAPSLVAEIPEVESAVGIAPPYLIDDIVLSIDSKKIKGVGEYAGKDFFHMFTYPLIEGSVQDVLDDKNDLVLSESTALKVFGRKDNLVGKQIEVEAGNVKQSLTVSGVFKDLPTNASNPFDFVLSYDNFLGQDDTFKEWGNYGPYAYVLLKPGSNINLVNDKIKNMIGTHGGGNNRTLFLKKYSENYLYGSYENGVQVGGRIEYVRMFALIALFILLIACVNFMNLSTAQASKRSKEVGVKKALGAQRGQLVVQYFVEAILMAFISLLFSTILVGALLPQFNFITGKNIEFTFDLDTVLPFVGITLITGIFAGIYPALYLSGFNPITVLKGKIRNSIGELWARRGLVVFQFVLSVVLIVFVLVVYKQVEFVRSRNLGYNKENLVSIIPEGKVSENLETFITEVRNIPGVVNAGASGHGLIGSGSQTSSITWSGKSPDNTAPFQVAEVTDNLIETLGLTFDAGQTFSNTPIRSQQIVLNQKALDVMGIKDNAIGKQITLWGDKMEIAGVVQNFNFESLRENVKPLLFVYDPSEADHIVIRIGKGDETNVIQRLEDLYAKFNPGYSLDYKFIDEQYQELYVSEQRVSSLASYFAGLAIIISCLGLFGLAIFTAQRRNKEMSIRKVIGANAFQIMMLLSSEFTRVVLIAVVIGLPLSYLLVNQWLKGFAYPVELKLWYFIGSGLGALLLAWITVATQSFKAAMISPAKSLKME